MGCSPIEITPVIGSDSAPLREDTVCTQFFRGTISKSFYLLVVDISNRLMDFSGRIGPFQSQTQARIFGVPIRLPPGTLRTASYVKGGKKKGPAPSPLFE